MDEQFEYTISPEQSQPRSPYADSPYVMAQPVQQPPKKEKKKTGNAWKVVLALVLAAALVAGSSIVTAVLVNRAWQEQTALLTESLNNRLKVLQSQIDTVDTAGTGAVVRTEGMTPGQVYAQNVRAVVAVSCVVQEMGSAYESFGSGFVLTPDGYVVSNAHVVEGATSITITTGDGMAYRAELVGYDTTNDIALLKADAQDLPYVELGSSDALAVGDQVMAIGNPLGELTSTLTVGYVSAKDRVVATDGTSINMLQTDAAINSGNSGGPLFNVHGQVVGITTAKYSGTSESGASIEGIGFAIPIDDVVDIVEDLREFGYVKTSYLGVYVRDVSEDAQSYGHPAGAYVEEVTPGFGAEAAGLQAGDTIIDLGGYAVGSTADLTRALRKFDAGDTTTITVFRKGGEVVLAITLSEAPEVQETETAEQPAYVAPGSRDDWYWDYFGDFFG